MKGTVNPVVTPESYVKLSCKPRLGRHQTGQSMTEYVIVCAVLAVCLFAASPVGALLASAIRAFYKDLTFFLSLP